MTRSRVDVQEKPTEVNTPASIDEVRSGVAFARPALISAATCALTVIVGYWPSANWAGPQGVAGLLAGVAIALVGGWVACCPVVGSLRKSAAERVNAILLSIVLRFVITLALAAAAALSGLFAPKPLILWVAIAQLIVLAVDTVGLVRLVKHGARVSQE